MEHMIPGTERSFGRGGEALWFNASRMTIFIEDRKGRPEFRLYAPVNSLDGALSFRSDEWSEVCRACAERWMAWITMQIGGGFHPDTPSDGYGFPLPTLLAAEYDHMIAFSHALLEDPYEISLDTMRRMGWIEGAISENAAGAALLQGGRPI